MSSLSSRQLRCRPVTTIVLWSCLIALVLGAAVGRAQDAGELTADIPRQPLPEALAAYARQTGLQLVYVSKIAQGKSSPGAPAGLTTRSALSRLLEGTGLQFEFLNERSVRIFPQRSPGPPPPPRGSAPTAPAGEPLEEVVVTALARRESVDRVPVTISVWTADKLEAAGITRLDGLAQQSVGSYFLVASRTGPGIDTGLFLRGLSQQAGNSAVIGVYLDDVPLHAYGSGAWGDMMPLTFDLDRVEVLYGPQGMLGGDSAEAGAVRLVSRQPSLTDWSGYASSVVAATEHGAPSYELGVAIGGPIAPERAGLRLGLWARTEGGFVDRVDPFTGVVVDANANHTSSSSARIAFTFAPTDTVRITPSLVRQVIDLHDSPAFYTYLSNPDAGRFLNGKLVRQPADDMLYLGSVAASVDFTAMRLTSLTAYMHRTMYAVSDTTNSYGAGIGGFGNPLGAAYPSSYSDAAPTTLNDKQTRLSQEFRLSSRDPRARFSWLWGVWLAHVVAEETGTTSPVDPNVAALLAGYSSVSASTLQADAFGQIDVRLTDRLRGSAGARFSHDRFDSTSAQSGPLYAGAPPSSEGQSSANTVAPRFDLTYTPADYGVLYLSIAKGYRLGGANPLNAPCSQPPVFAGDYVWSYEAGAKVRSADASLQIDAAVFHLDFHDIQDQGFTECGGIYIANKGTAASDGFDLTMHLEPLARLQLGAAVEYADARYTESVSLPSYDWSVSAGDALGVAPHVAPPWSGNAWINAIVSPAPQPVASVLLSAAFRSHHPGPFFTEVRAPGWVADPATTLLNLRAQLGWPSLEIAAFVNNVLDAHPPLSHMTDFPAATLYYDVTFRPRTLGAALTWRF